MNKHLTSLSLQTKVISLVAILMIALSVAQIFKSHRAAVDQVESETHLINDIGVKTLLENLRAEFPSIDYMASADGELTRVSWPDMPTVLPDDRVDVVGSTTGLHVTVFRWIASDQEYIRDATTIQTENGRAVGTYLARGPVYDAMIAAEGFRATTDILGESYVTYYQPVVDAAGQPMGILFVGREVSAMGAALAMRLVTTIALTAAVLAVALTAAFVLLRALLRPLSTVTATITALSNNDLEVELPDKDRDDEIGKIAVALGVLRNSMLDARERAEAEKMHQRDQETVVKVLGEALSDMSKLDLTKKIATSGRGAFPEEYDGLRISFNSLADSLADTIAKIRTGAEDVSAGATELANSSEELSKRTENQAATLEQSAAALEELSQSVNSTSDNAANAESSMQENRQAANAAGAIVRDAVAAMERIENSSAQIARIISVIDEIAFQTNLLALNAGVEAARAGEAGHGFAVVASEVRSLALRSSESAKEIRDLIQDSSEEVAAGSELVNKAGTALEDIVERIEGVSGLISDIANSAKQQSSGIGELNIGVRELDNVTQHNAAMSEEASASSNTVRKAAEDLVRHVAAFTTSDLSASRMTHSAIPIPKKLPDRPANLGEAAEIARVSGPPRRAAANDASGGSWSEF